MNALQKPGEGNDSQTTAVMATAAPVNCKPVKRSSELKRMATRALRNRRIQTVIPPVLFKAPVSTLEAVKRAMDVCLEIAENTENTARERAVGAAVVTQAAKEHEHLTEQALRLEKECADKTPRNSPPIFNYIEGQFDQAAGPLGSP
jgi:hypothetical protein